MTVKTLMEKLSHVDPDMDVFIHQEESEDFTYAPLDDVSVKLIPFREEPELRALAETDVVVLSTN